jgi:hypothetical protein
MSKEPKCKGPECQWWEKNEYGRFDCGMLLRPDLIPRRYKVCTLFTPKMERVELPKTADNVNHPDHYTRGGIECIEAIRASMDKAGFLGYCKGNVEKYVWRYEDKNGAEDLKKARWYIERMIQEVENAE